MRPPSTFSRNPVCAEVALCEMLEVLLREITPYFLPGVGF